MSTKTMDDLMPFAPRSNKTGALTGLIRAISGPFESLGRAIEASHLVECGVDPREAFNRVYKDTPLRDL